MDSEVDERSTAGKLLRREPAAEAGNAAAADVLGAREVDRAEGAVADQVVPRVIERLSQDGVQFRLDKRALALANGSDHVQPAGDGDWDIEWLDLIMGIRVVPDLDAALAAVIAANGLQPNPGADQRVIVDGDHGDRRCR